MSRKEAYPVYINLTKKTCHLVIPDFNIVFESNNIKTLVQAIENARAFIENAAKELEESGKEIPIPDSCEYKKSRGSILTYVDVNLDKLFRKKTLAELEILEEDRVNSMWNVRENVIEFLLNQKVMAATLTQKKYINKVKAYAKSYPDEVRIVKENEDGSIFAKMPTNYLRITRPPEGRIFTEEEKEISKKHLEEGRLKRKAEIEKERSDLENNNFEKE